MKRTRLSFVSSAVPRASIKWAFMDWFHLEICGDKTVTGILNYVIYILLSKFQANMVPTEKIISLVFKFVIPRSSLLLNIVDVFLILNRKLCKSLTTKDTVSKK